MKAPFESVKEPLHGKGALRQGCFTGALDFLAEMRKKSDATRHHNGGPIMPRSDRNFLFAVIGLLILSGIVWTLMLPPTPTIPSNQYLKAADSDYSPGSVRCFPSRLSRLPETEASDERYRCEQGAEERRLKSDDLIQQTRAADSAVAMVDLTYRQMLLGIAGAIFGVLTLIAAAFAAWYARDAAYAAREGLAHDKGVAALQLRPWVDINLRPDWALIYPDKLIISCDVTLKNIGSIPAQNVCTGVATIVMPKVATHDCDDTSYIEIPDKKETYSALLPNGEYVFQEMWVIEWSKQGFPDARAGITPRLGIRVYYDLPGAPQEGVTERWFYVGRKDGDDIAAIRISYDDEGEPNKNTEAHDLTVRPSTYGWVQ